MKKIIVIGGGISGLTAAIYAQRSGFEVTVCEQHSIAGGMCTSWKRKGYLFEGGIHWLTGSSPETSINQLWRETGALNENVPVFLHEPFYAVEWEGKTICLYRNIEKTAEHLIAVSPQDKNAILRLVKNVKKSSGMQMPLFDIKNVKSKNPKRMGLGMLFKMIPVIPVLIKYSKISCKDFAGQFKHPGIQQLLCFMPNEYTASSLIFTLATLNIGDGGYPEGGSLAMVQRMVRTFEGLGGKLLLKTRVQKVNIKNQKAVGVTLEDGTALDADAVIVSQETIAAMDRLFDTPLREPWLLELRKNTKPAVCTFIGVGVRAELPVPIPMWKLKEPIHYAGKTETTLGFYNNSGLEGYAPKGCSVLTTIFMGDTYDFWKKAKEEGRYEEEKNSIAGQVSRAICQKYPQAENNIEVIDIATPLTYERYTGAWHGSWMNITGVGDKMKTYPGYLNDISGLYFTGHRLMPPGGLPVAVSTGRLAAQMVCRQFDMMFINQLP